LNAPSVGSTAAADELRRIFGDGVNQAADLNASAFSRKPDEAYARIEQYSAGPRADLFARERRRGWDFFGDELVWKDAAA